MNTRTAAGIPVLLKGGTDELVHRADARKSRTTHCGKWWQRLAPRQAIAQMNRCALCWDLDRAIETTGGV